MKGKYCAKYSAEMGINMRKEIVTDHIGKILGRTLWKDGICYLGYSASEIGFWYTGERIIADLLTDDYRNQEAYQAWIGVIIGEDTTPWKRFPLEAAEAEYLIFDRVEYAKFKGIKLEELPSKISVRLIKYSEAAFGIAGIRYLLVDDKAVLEPLPAKEKRIEFIGDSITCGYGVEGIWNVDVFNTPQENPMEAYAVLTANGLGADYHLVSWSGIGLISDWVPDDKNEPDTTILMPQIYPYTNYSLSTRLQEEPELWNPNRFLPDLVVIHLGTNDASYTREDKKREEVYIEAYKNLYKKVRENYKDAEVVCCLGIMDRTLCPAVAQMVRQMQIEGDKKIHYMEFDGQQEADGIGADWHPSRITHKKAAEKLIDFCRPLLFCTTQGKQP